MYNGCYLWVWHEKAPVIAMNTKPRPSPVAALGLNVYVTIVTDLLLHEPQGSQ